MGLQWAEHKIEIAATPDQVFDAITDYETFAGWQSAVITAKVTESDKKTGLGEVVEYEIDGKVRTVRYTLRYRYDRPEKIDWDFVEGEGLNTLDGGYVIKPAGSGATATYKVGIDVSGVPGPVLKRVHKATIRKANEDLKAEAERRAAAGSGSSAGDYEPADPSAEKRPSQAPAPDEDHPFDLLPGPLPELAKLPGKVMVKIGKRLGG